MIKQKYKIQIVPHFGNSRCILKEESFLIPCIDYDVYCNGEFVRRYLTEDSLRVGLRIIKDLALRSQELVVEVDNSNINHLKF